MPKCDVYATNGGYGGVLLSIDHALPMVCAGINEGKMRFVRVSTISTLA